jgi:signal transduction histidine kinase
LPTLIISLKSSIVLLSIIGGAAIILSLISYQLYLSASAQVLETASEQIRSNARIQSNDISQTLENKVDSLTGNLQIIANSKGVQEQAIDRGQSLLAAAQDSTSDLTDGYFWLDKNGLLVWSTTIAHDPTKAAQYLNADLSFRSYFTEPRQTMRPYFSGSIEPVDQSQPTIFISYPIINQKDKSFQGIIATGVKTETLGGILTKELSPEMQGTVGLIDRNGVLLYSSDTSQIGKDVFGKDYQDYIKNIFSEQEAEKLDTFVTKSLHNEKTASQDVSALDGTKLTLAYSSIFVESQRATILYVAVPIAIPATTGSVIAGQQFVSIVEIAIIAVISVAVAFVIISWNKNLQQTVKEKTDELRRSNENLAKSNKQLAQSERMQNEFIKIAAHELRTPIQPLLGMADILESQFGGGKDEIQVTKPEVDMIVRNARRLERLSSDILQVSRIESNSLTLNKKPTYLSEMIKTIIEDERGTILKGKEITIVYDNEDADTGQLPHPHEERPIMAEVDGEKILQVLSNLLSNAKKFTEKGTIIVRCKTLAQQAIISVSDTGEGIDEEIMPMLFTKFATKSNTGTGLGLFISKSIIEAHGGKIWAENNIGGKGATFSFAIPLLIAAGM